MMIHRYLRSAAASAALVAGLALAAPASAVDLPDLPDQARVPASVADLGQPADVPGDLPAHDLPENVDDVLALIDSGLRGRELADALRALLDDEAIQSLIASISAELPDLPDQASVPADPGKPADAGQPDDLPDGANTDRADAVREFIDGELTGKDLGEALRALLQPADVDTLAASINADLPDLPDQANVPADPGKPADLPDAPKADVGASIRAMVDTGLRGKELADAIRAMLEIHGPVPEAIASINADLPDLPDQANVPENPGKPADLPNQAGRGAQVKGLVDTGLRGQDLADSVRGLNDSDGETESFVASINADLPDLPDQANVPENPGKPADAGKPTDLPVQAGRGAEVKTLVESGLRGQDLADAVRDLNGSGSETESLIASVNADLPDLPDQANVPENPGKPADAGKPADLPTQAGRGAEVKALVESGTRGQDLADAVRPAPANESNTDSLIAAATTPTLPDLPDQANVPSELGKPADVPVGSKPTDVPAGGKPAGVPVSPERPVTPPVTDTPFEPTRPVTPPVVDTPVAPVEVASIETPVAPERPVTPPVIDTPVTPTRPVDTPVSDTPVEPTRPVTPPVVDTPVVPTRPVDPGPPTDSIPTIETPTAPAFDTPVVTPTRPVTPPIVDTPVVPTRPVVAPPVDTPPVSIPTPPAHDAHDHDDDHLGHVVIHETTDPYNARGHKHNDYISWDTSPTTDEIVDVTVYVDNGNGLLTSNMLNRVSDAVAGINSHSLLNIVLTEDGGADYNVRFSMDSSASGNVLGQASYSFFTQPIGEASDGDHVFLFAGEDTPGGNAEVTIFSGWNWFDGSGTDIAGNQMDFLSVATHELLHIVGLAHDDTQYLDDSLLDGNDGNYSVMASSIGSGMLRRALSAEDILGLELLYGPGQSEPTGDGGDDGGKDKGGPPDGKGRPNRLIASGGVHAIADIPTPGGGAMLLAGLGMLMARRNKRAA